jgi:hypothetical protein
MTEITKNIGDLLHPKFIDSPVHGFERGDSDISINGRMFHFPIQVYTKVELSDRIIVGFSYGQLKSLLPEGAEYWRAVCCYDFDGNLLWRVQPAYYIDRRTKEKIIASKDDRVIQTVEYWKPYDKLVVYGRMGYEVDPETGELGEIVYRER